MEPDKPVYKVKKYIERKRDGMIKAVLYGIERPDGSIVNEYKTTDKQDRERYLDRLKSMGYCNG